MFTEISVFGRPAAMLQDGHHGAWVSVNICGLKLPMPPNTGDTEGASFGPTCPKAGSIIRAGDKLMAFQRRSVNAN